MSTIVRSAGRRGPTTGSRDAGERVSPSARGPLSARAVRVRNACLRSAASDLGLPIPGDEDLSALGADVTLARALESWRTAHGQHDVAAESELRGRRGRVVLRTALTTAVTLLALALSFGRVQ